jgi:hypothetical protein
MGGSLATITDTYLSRKHGILETGSDLSIYQPELRELVPEHVSDSWPVPPRPS